ENADDDRDLLAVDQVVEHGGRAEDVAEVEVPVLKHHDAGGGAFRIVLSGDVDAGGPDRAPKEFALPGDGGAGLSPGGPGRGQAVGVDVVMLHLKEPHAGALLADLIRVTKFREVGQVGEENEDVGALADGLHFRLLDLEVVGDQQHGHDPIIDVVFGDGNGPA